MTTPDNPFAAPEPGAGQPDAPSYGSAPPPGYGAPSYGPPSPGQPPYGPGQPAVPYGQQYGAPPTGPPGFGPPPYGGPVPPPYGYAPGFGFGVPASSRTNGMAIASLVLGCVWLWWIGSILALVFGYLAKGQIKRTGESGGGLATAGIVLGWIGLLFLVLFLGLVIIGGSGYGTFQYDDYSSSPAW